jgi:hypothetical protein
MMFSPSAVITAVTTWITLVGPESKGILTVEGDGLAMISRLTARLRRLESQLAPTILPLPHILIEYSDPNGEGSEEWWPPGCQPTEEERRWAAKRKQTQKEADSIGKTSGFCRGPQQAMDSQNVADEGR